MADLIERQAAIDVLNEVYCHIEMVKKRPVNKTEQAVYFDMIGAVKSVPSTQPEQKVGKWIVMDDIRISGICSVCGWEAHLYEDDVVGMDYCPNCGAKMEG